MIQPPKDLTQFESLLQIVEDLRGPHGCPWDKEQNHHTLAPYAIEEAHELAEAIEAGDEPEMITELGDLLLQVVIHSEIGRQENRFTINEVIESISSKMVRRHPHVFSDTKVTDSNEVLNNWSKIKAKEKAAKANKEEAMRFDISLNLPSLFRSHKIGDKTKRERFDWPNANEVLHKVDEELAELKEVMNQPGDLDRDRLEHELGDLLFSVAQLARHLNLEAEQCLRTTNARFEKRFFTMKKRIAESGRDYESLSTDELEQEWQKTKVFLENEAKIK